jgi:peptidylprolyl isomerase
MRTVIAMTAVAFALVFSACSRSAPSAETGSTPSIPPPPDVGAPPSDAIRTPTGLASKVLSPGTGTRHPRPNSQVVVHYTGWTTDGKMFDSSVARGEPASFALNGVIAGWTEGVQMMVVGEKRRFWIPAQLAYEGKDGPQGMLVFDIELIKIDS